MTDAQLKILQEMAAKRRAKVPAALPTSPVSQTPPAAATQAPQVSHVSAPVAMKIGGEGGVKRSGANTDSGPNSSSNRKKKRYKQYEEQQDSFCIMCPGECTCHTPVSTTAVPPVPVPVQEPVASVAPATVPVTEPVPASVPVALAPAKKAALDRETKEEEKPEAPEVKRPAYRLPVVTRRAGIPNISRISCYFNAVTQCLASMNIESYADRNSPEFLKKFDGIIGILRFGDLPFKKTVETCFEEQAREIFGAEKHREQDAEQFLTAVLDRFPREVRSSFEIDLKSQLRCEHCNRSRIKRESVINRATQREEKNTIISLSFDEEDQKKTFVTLDKLIEKYKKTELLEGTEAVRCQYCDINASTTKKFILDDVNPEFLIVQLKRFDADARTGVMRKIKTPVILEPQTKVGKCMYNLTGIVHHEGELIGGHYTAHVLQGEQWLYCNDTRVIPNGAVTEGFTPYLLFFSKAHAGDRPATLPKYLTEPVAPVAPRINRQLRKEKDSDSKESKAPKKVIDDSPVACTDDEEALAAGVSVIDAPGAARPVTFGELSDFGSDDCNDDDDDGDEEAVEPAGTSKKSGTKKDAKRFACEFKFPDGKICDKTYKKKFSFDQHLISHSDNPKPFQCEYCGKGFTEDSSRTRHERIHTDEKPYECKYCEKCFSDAGARTSHERTHTRERPYGCKYCKKSFVQPTHRTAHERTHRGEKPYECRYCDERFAYSGNRDVHERDHTGEKPYECTDCGKRFKHRATFKSHEFRHTGISKYQCTLCRKYFGTLTGLKGHKAGNVCDDKPHLKGLGRRKKKSFFDEGLFIGPQV